MNKRLLVLLVAGALAGCGTFGSNKGITPAADATTPIKETKITTNFTDEGVKLHYTMSGKLERIEVVGVAPAWKRNHDIIAEADAMDKLVKFVHGKNVSSDRRIKIISKALDQASDLTSNKFSSNEGVIETDSKALEAELKNDSGEQTQRLNTAKRNARIVDETTVNAVQTITASGRLVGVRKTGDTVKDDGKTYVAYYQWSFQDMDTAMQVRNAMMKGN